MKTLRSALSKRPRSAKRPIRPTPLAERTRDLRLVALALLGRLAFELPSKSSGNPSVCIAALFALTVAVVVVCCSRSRWSRPPFA